MPVTRRIYNSKHPNNKATNRNRYTRMLPNAVGINKFVVNTRLPNVKWIHFKIGNNRYTLNNEGYLFKLASPRQNKRNLRGNVVAHFTTRPDIFRH